MLDAQLGSVYLRAHVHPARASPCAKACACECACAWLRVHGCACMSVCRVHHLTLAVPTRAARVALSVHGQAAGDAPLGQSVRGQRAQ
eukprot:406267-Pleurochrysis_carterae.AAC.1